MADIELDWRERPMLSPFGGWFIQSRAGENGNFEVVIPWLDGGLAHFWRDNDNDVFRWHGPSRFGSGNYIGITVIESDFRHISARLGNLEVLATRADGVVDQYWRENGGSFAWHGPFTIFSGAGAAPSMAYSGAPFVGGGSTAHRSSHFFVVTPIKGAGFSYRVRHNWETGIIEWEDLGGTGAFTLSGVGFAITTINHGFVHSGYKYLGLGGDQIVVGVAPHLGWLPIWVNFHDITQRTAENWRDFTVIGRDVFPELDGQFIGRPCLIQGDYGYKAPSELPFGSAGHLGNLELIVPARQGGFIHFWRDSGVPRATHKPIQEGWQGPLFIPGPTYDECSLIQSNFSHGEHGNLELVARRFNQRGFDFFWRDEQFVWHGPQTVGDSPTGVGTTHQPITTVDKIRLLLAANIDFSVPEMDVKEWLNNPQFTPYPAVTAVLLNLTHGRQFRKPVFLDVIVFNYENTRGIASPRKPREVNIDKLKAAVVKGYNTRHGEAERNFEYLLQ